VTNCIFNVNKNYVKIKANFMIFFDLSKILLYTLYILILYNPVWKTFYEGLWFFLKLVSN